LLAALGVAREALDQAAAFFSVLGVGRAGRERRRRRRQERHRHKECTFHVRIIPTGRTSRPLTGNVISRR
jgi:hypothetical protein